MHSGTRAGALCLGILLLAGCGGGMAPVKGRLVYPDGSPAADLKNAQVVFEGVGPDGKGYSAAGTVDETGRFVLTTERAGDGAVLGKNKVLVAPYVPDPERPPPKIIDPKFEAFATSGLEADVTAGGPNDFTFTVERAKAEPKKAAKK